MANWADAIVSPLKSASEMAQRLMKIRDTVKFGDAIIELQAQIMAAQQGALAAQTHETTMAEEIAELKKHMTELEAWETEKERYQLTKLTPGVFVYALKAEIRGAEPTHYICANCYENRKKSILHSKGTINGLEMFDCKACGAEFRTGIFQRPPVKHGGISRGRGSWMGT